MATQGEGGSSKDGPRRVVKEVDVYLAQVDTLLPSTSAAAHSKRTGKKYNQSQQGVGSDTQIGQAGGDTSAQGALGEHGSKKAVDWRQIVMLQYPLRPQDRPYPTADVKAVRVKPQNQRIEIDVPLSQESLNYDDSYKTTNTQLSNLTLRYVHMKKRVALAF